MVEKSLRVRKIKHGTVIDHIAAGKALMVMKFLEITGNEGDIVSIAMNVPTGKLSVMKKDVIKIENKELNAEDYDKIALISPEATVNIIRDFEVISKEKVTLPKTIQGIITCINPNCVTNASEPVQPQFDIESNKPLLMRCHYCGMIMNKEDIISIL
ncbi:MAG: aspartate carbamoyltransferase regulatory subunit [Candidatus Helarchaeota archaeon]